MREGVFKHSIKLLKGSSDSIQGKLLILLEDVRDSLGARVALGTSFRFIGVAELEELFRTFGASLHLLVLGPKRDVEVLGKSHIAIGHRALQELGVHTFRIDLLLHRNQVQVVVHRIRMDDKVVVGSFVDFIEPLHKVLVGLANVSIGNDR